MVVTPAEVHLRTRPLLTRLPLVLASTFVLRGGGTERYAPASLDEPRWAAAGTEALQGVAAPQGCLTVDSCAKRCPLQSTGAPSSAALPLHGSARAAAGDRQQDLGGDQRHHRMEARRLHGDSEVQGHHEAPDSKHAEHGQHGHHGIHEHHGHQGHHSHHHVELNDPAIQIDVAVACVMLGGIFFQMGLFWILHYKDVDIKLHAWDSIGTTISIFCAVLIFTSIAGLVEVMIVTLVGNIEEARITAFVVNVVMYILWFVIMHAAMCRFAFKRESHVASYRTLLSANRHGDEDVQAAQERHLGMRCWALLLAHTTAFAAIHCGVFAMQGMFSVGLRSPVLYWIPVVVVLFSMIGGFRLADYIRSEIFNKIENEVVGAHEEWDEVGEESEDDVAGLALSFLIVQVIRYQISGVLPDATGTEEDMQRHSLSEIACLYSFGVAFAVIMTLSIAVLVRQGDPKLHVYSPKSQNMTGLDPWSDYLKRWVRMIPEVAVLSSMWCFLFSSKWLFQWTPELAGLPFEPNSVTPCSILALISSFAAFVLLFVLDHVADRQYGGAVITLALRVLMKAIGFLIGISWELAFDAGVESIAETTEHLGWWIPPTAKLSMAIIVSLVVIPGYRTHILRHVLRLQEQHEHKMEQEQNAAMVAAELTDSTASGSIRGLMAVRSTE